MDPFADGAHVRLRSPTRGIETFLCADADWLGVSVRPLHRVPFLSTVWRVRHQTRNGDTFLLLQGAAYGRYLAVSPFPSPPPLRGRAAVQRCFDGSRVLDDVLWRPISVNRSSTRIRLHNFMGHLHASEDALCGRGRRSRLGAFTDTDMRRTRWVVEAVEAASAPGLPLRSLVADPLCDAMHLFPDGAFVQLRCIAPGCGGMCICADPDSRAISLSRRDRVPFETTVWRVHHWNRERGVTFILLQGAAYGSYLGALSGPEGTVHSSQCSYEAEDAHGWMWEPFEILSGIVGLRNVRYDCLVTGDPRRLHQPHAASASTGEALPFWEVHLIPRSLTPPALPPPDASDKGGFSHSFMRQDEPLLLQRTIRFVRADTEGNYPNTWEEFCFNGCSVINLIAEVAERLETPFRILLCVHNGCFGRLTPLVVNLPRNTHTMDIVVLHATSPAAARFGYPKLDPPAP